MPEIGGVSLAIAFAAGLLSCLSPCALPMVPTYVGYLGGATATASADRHRWMLFLHAVAFMAGFTAIFVAIGASVGLIGWVLRDNLDLLQKGAGILMIAFGLHLSGVLQIPGFEREARLDYNPVGRVGYVRSALVGSAYAIGWTPMHRPDARSDSHARRRFRDSLARNGSAQRLFTRHGSSVSRHRLSLLLRSPVLSAARAIFGCDFVRKRSSLNRGGYPRLHWVARQSQSILRLRPLVA